MTLTAIKLIEGHVWSTLEPTTMFSEVSIDYADEDEAEIPAILFAFQGYLVSTEEVV